MSIFNFWAYFALLLALILCAFQGDSVFSYEVNGREEKVDVSMTLRVVLIALLVCLVAWK